MMEQIIPKLENLKKNIGDKNKNQVLNTLNELVKKWENQNKIY